MKKKLSSIRRLLIVITIAAPVFSCSTDMSPSVEVGPDGRQSLAVEDPEERLVARNALFRDMTEGLSSYQIAPGDVLEAMYLFNNEPQPFAYKLGVSDKIRIEFHYTDEKPRTLIVRPDGMVTVPFKGDVMAAGVSPAELGKQLEESYKDLFRNPLITVSVEEFSTRLEDLRLSLRNISEDRAQKLVVSPEGLIYLPYLDGIRVSGLSIDSARNLVNEQYRRKFGNIEVSLILDTVTGNKIFVFGEVARPGVIRPSGPITVMQALASAGGQLPTGSLSEVKVLYWSETDMQPRLRTVNLNRVIEEQRIEEDLILPGNSTVYVPPTGITTANRAIDQYLKRLFLFNGVSIGLNYQINEIN